MKPMTTHKIYSGEFPPMEASHTEYWLAGNGLLVRAERDELLVLSPIADAGVRGLPCLTEHIESRMPLVPVALVEEMIERAQFCASNGLEILFYLKLTYDRWELIRPEQEQTPHSCRPVDETAGRDAMIEVHSHHNLAIGARFSGTDDLDETGFRVYAVMGHLSTDPEICVRIGVYGDFFEVGADFFFEMPAGLRDVNAEIGEGEFEEHGK